MLPRLIREMFDGRIFGEHPPHIGAVVEPLVGVDGDEGNPSVLRVPWSWMHVFPVTDAVLATAMGEENILKTFFEGIQEQRRVDNAVRRVESLPVHKLETTACKRRELHLGRGWKAGELDGGVRVGLREIEYPRGGGGNSKSAPRVSSTETRVEGSRDQSTATTNCKSHLRAESHAESHALKPNHTSHSHLSKRSETASASESVSFISSSYLSAGPSLYSPLEAAILPGSAATTVFDSTRSTRGRCLTSQCCGWSKTVFDVLEAVEPSLFDTRRGWEF